MHFDFWINRWENNEIGFHGNEANPALVDHFEKMTLRSDARVFVPLCGKTLDIAWLLSKGFRVVGIEWSRRAVEDLFKELGEEPEISKVGKLLHYALPKLDIFVGDVFELSSEVLGSIDAVYDRAALVALPAATRIAYTKHLREISGACDQLLITFEYEQQLIEGPPFSVDSSELQRHFAESHEIRLLETKELPQGMKGAVDALERVWWLKRG